MKIVDQRDDVIKTFGNGVLRYPYDATVASNGLIYVTDSNNHRVVAFDYDGNVRKTFGTAGTNPEQSSSTSLTKSISHHFRVLRH